MTECTPTVGELRQAYVEASGASMAQESYYAEQLAEFERGIARIRAEALREAADEYATSDREQTHGVTSVLMSMYHRADRTEKEAGDE